MAKMAETAEERRKREEREKAEMTGIRSKGSLGGTRTENYKPDVIISGATPEPNTPVLRGPEKQSKKKKLWRGITRMAKKWAAGPIAGRYVD